MKDLYDFSTAKRGAVAPGKNKTRITIMLDDVVLDAARQRADELGMGYQTLINSTLKQALCEAAGQPQHAMLGEILSTLATIAEGQELIRATLDSSLSAPLGGLTTSNQRPGAMLAAREDHGPLEAQLKRKKKTPEA
ncbi:MAG: BrnA antitoxin family protein [Pseudomonas sp.]